MISRREFLTGARKPEVVVPVSTFAGLKVLGLLPVASAVLILEFAIFAARK